MSPMSLDALGLAASSGTTIALGWTLVHFLWQGTLIAIALEALLVCMRTSSSEARYLVRCGALALMGVVPVLTFLALRDTALAAPVDPLPLSALLAELPGAWDGVSWPALAVALWSVGAALFGARLLRDYLRIRRLQTCEDAAILPAVWQARFDSLAGVLGVRAVARVVDSASMAAPAVIGWLRPVVLLPARVLTGLDADQIEALIAHELAHVRRHDYLVNLLQSALEALLFYHPAVWWVSRGIRTEREFCCDDVALRLTTDRLAYARALTTLESWRGAQPQVGMSTLGGSLMHRIQRLLGIHSSSPRPRGSRSALGALLVAGALGASAFGYASPSGAAPVQDTQELREMRRQLAEMQARMDEMRAQLERAERAQGLPRRALAPERVDRGERRAVREAVESARRSARPGRVRARAGSRVDTDDLHERIQEALEAARGEGEHGGVRLELHPEPSAEPEFRLHLEPRIELHVSPHVEVDPDEEGHTLRHRIEVDRHELDDVRAQLRKAFEAAGDSEGGVSVDTHFEFRGFDGDDEDVHEHLEELHEHLTESLGAHFRHRTEVDEHHLPTLGSRFRHRVDGSDVDVERIHEQVRKALEDAGVRGGRGARRVELHGVPDAAAIREQVREALRAAGVRDGSNGGRRRIEVKIDGSEDLEDLEGLHLRLREAFERAGLHGHDDEVELPHDGDHDLHEDGHGGEDDDGGHRRAPAPASNSIHKV